MSNKTNEKIMEHQEENKEVLALKELLASENRDKTQDMIVASYKLIMGAIVNWEDYTLKVARKVEEQNVMLAEALKELKKLNKNG
jgi:hypothetical protein